MPDWLPAELQQIAELTAVIGVCAMPRRRPRLSAPLDLKLSAAIPLLQGLAGGTRALLVRQLLRDLGFDEHRHFEWRLEHKLVQALLLHSYSPGVVPVTRGLHACLAGAGARAVPEFLAAEFPAGFRIKTALGDSSGECANGDRTDDIVRSMQDRSPAILPHPLIDEAYVVQERIAIAQEYRIHSLEGLVIEDLTFRRYAGGSIPGERDAPNAFVQHVLDALPDAIVGGSLLAWDVALAPDGSFAVIEVNFSGFHPVYRPGFHCSGYYHDYYWGACDTARLLHHVAREDGIEVTVCADAPDYPAENGFYASVADWQRRHAAAHTAIHAAPGASSIHAELPHGTPEEPAQIAPLLQQIDNHAAPRRRPALNSSLELSLSAAIPLLPGLAASTRALLTRQLLHALGFDELRLPAWRLEHKLTQALVFNHYAQASLPATCGLDRIRYGLDPANLRECLHARFPRGFVVKTALGDGSGDDCDYRTEAALSWIETGGRLVPMPALLTDEEFIVQERVAIRQEYRVHTVEDQVIEDLTVRRHHGAVGPGERQGPNAYVQTIMDALPAGITAGSILAWDVALTGDGSFVVIEINIGGIHTVYNRGFHSSGYFHHQHYGCVYTARLLNFVERTYACSITVIADAPAYPVENHFYEAVADWKTRF